MFMGNARILNGHFPPRELSHSSIERFRQGVKRRVGKDCGAMWVSHKTSVKRNTFYFTGLILANAYKNKITSSKKPNIDTAVAMKVPAIEASGKSVLWSSVFGARDCCIDVVICFTETSRMNALMLRHRIYLLIIQDNTKLYMPQRG